MYERSLVLTLDAIQQMIDAVKCRALGPLLPPRTTKGPSRPPSGSAPTGKAPTGAPTGKAPTGAP